MHYCFSKMVMLANEITNTTTKAIKLRIEFFLPLIDGMHIELTNSKMYTTNQKKTCIIFERSE